MGDSELNDRLSETSGKLKEGMNKFTEKLRDFHNNHQTIFYVVLVVIVVILLVVSIKLIKKKIKWHKNNPTFFRSSIDVSKKGVTIPNDDLHRTPQSNSSSMFFWVNINSLKNNKVETVLGHPMSVHIQKNGTVNNLSVKIPQNPSKNFTIKDYPMNRWFSIGIVIVDNNMDVYIDGKLIKSIFVSNKNIDGTSNILLSGADNSDITIGPFQGEFASFSYSSTTYTAHEVAHFQRKGPLTNPWLAKLFGYLGDIESQPKCGQTIKDDTKSYNELKKWNKKLFGGDKNKLFGNDKKKIIGDKNKLFSL